MPRVQLPELMSAINQVKALTPEQTGKMLDEIYKEQKNLLSSILALRDKGLYAQQHIDTLMYILLVTWQSLKNANVRLKPISIKLQKEQLAAYVFYFELADKQPEEKRPAIGH